MPGGLVPYQSIRYCDPKKRYPVLVHPAAVYTDYCNNAMEFRQQCGGGPTNSVYFERQTQTLILAPKCVPRDMDVTQWDLTPAYPDPLWLQDVDRSTKTTALWTLGCTDVDSWSAVLKNAREFGGDSSIYGGSLGPHVLQHDEGFVIRLQWLLVGAGAGIPNPNNYEIVLYFGNYDGTVYNGNGFKLVLAFGKPATLHHRPHGGAWREVGRLAGLGPIDTYFNSKDRNTENIFVSVIDHTLLVGFGGLSPNGRTLSWTEAQTADVKLRGVTLPASPFNDAVAATTVGRIKLTGKGGGAGFSVFPLVFEDAGYLTSAPINRGVVSQTELIGRPYFFHTDCTNIHKKILGNNVSYTAPIGPSFSEDAKQPDNPNIYNDGVFQSSQNCIVAEYLTLLGGTWYQYELFLYTHPPTAAQQPLCYDASQSWFDAGGNPYKTPWVKGVYCEYPSKWKTFGSPTWMTLDGVRHISERYTFDQTNRVVFTNYSVTVDSFHRNYSDGLTFGYRAMEVTLGWDIGGTRYSKLRCCGWLGLAYQPSQTHNLATTTIIGTDRWHPMLEDAKFLYSPTVDGWESGAAMRFFANAGMIHDDDIGFQFGDPFAYFDTTKYHLPIGMMERRMLDVPVGTSPFQPMLRVNELRGGAMYFQNDGVLKWRSWLPEDTGQLPAKTFDEAQLVHPASPADDLSDALRQIWQVNGDFDCRPVKNRISVWGRNPLTGQMFFGGPLVDANSQNNMDNNPYRNYKGYVADWVRADSQFSSQAAVADALDVIAAVVSKPVETLTFQTWGQPFLFPLDIIRVNARKVSPERSMKWFITDMTSEMDMPPGGAATYTTTIVCRYLPTGAHSFAADPEVG